MGVGGGEVLPSGLDRDCPVAACGAYEFLDAPTVGFDRRPASCRNVFDRYFTELTGVDLRFQPNADASSLCFASGGCTLA